MAKKKKSSHKNDSGDKDKKSSSIKSSNRVKTSHSKMIVISAVLAITLFIICVVIISLPRNNENNANNSSNHQQTSNRTEKKDAFLNWFVKNGGTFHPIRLHDETVNVTIETFPEYGGWGLALPIPPESNRIATIAEQCIQPSSEGEDDSMNERECPVVPNTTKPPIIRHLDPLFTVPSNIIITVQSILEMYAYPKTSSRYLPNFYSTVNKILTTGRNGRSSSSTGLAQRGMTLADQNVVIGMYLMVEECQHHHTNLFNNANNNNENKNGVSYWGEYLDVLPQYTIPRLDTFNDEEYAALKDWNLERSGRSSKRRLEEMYNGITSTSGSAETLSLRSVVQDMIRQRMNNERLDIPEACINFDKFHRFVGIVSSRGMVLKGHVHLTPLAGMINYAPKVDESKDWIRAPFDLYHTLADDGSITVRSDRDIFPTESLDEGSDTVTAIQLFEDYGPVDSSLFLEAHGFVPKENPSNCATISGSLFLRRNAAVGRYDENAELLLHGLKSLYLIHPGVKQFETLDDVCVKENLEMIDDGTDIGRKPASDSIAMASLLLGNTDNPTWDRIESEFGQSFTSLRDRCIAAIHLNDTERMELRCARYDGADIIVKYALRKAAMRALVILEEKNSNEKGDLVQLLEQAKAEGKHQLALALRFRQEERNILRQVAAMDDQEIDRRFESRIEHKEMPETKLDDKFDLEKKLHYFKDFVETLDFPVNKIEAKLVEDGMRIGAFATEDIALDEVYISVPPNSVIDFESALAGVDNETSAFATLLKKYTHLNNDEFDALLVHILHERFVIRERSRWFPYLNLLPTIDELVNFHPLFFEVEDIDRYLAGSDVRRFILKYQQHALEKHKALSSDIEANLVLGSDVVLDKTKVYWAMAILDSRSIWWNGKRHLVPLLDLVNADNMGRAHETRVEEEEGVLAVTRTSRQVKRGEQVFENYGQPNHLLFSYHGFLLKENSNDCALLDGLAIRRNDPGAKSAGGHSPTFCIRDAASIDDLAKFLRVKHGLLQNDDVRPYLIGVLEERIARLNESVEMDIDDDRNVSPTLKSMRQMVKNDLHHFQYALDNHVLSVSIEE